MFFDRIGTESRAGLPRILVPQVVSTWHRADQSSRRSRKHDAATKVRLIDRNFSPRGVDPRVDLVESRRDREDGAQGSLPQARQGKLKQCVKKHRSRLSPTAVMTFV